MSARTLKVQVRSMVTARNLRFDQHLVDVEYDRLPIQWMPEFAGISWPEHKCHLYERRSLYVNVHIRFDSVVLWHINRSACS
jgi:hypothetical protein